MNAVLLCVYFRRAWLAAGVLPAATPGERTAHVMEETILTRRLICLMICLLVLSAALPAHASFAQLPDRQTFSLGYDRLQKAIARERPVTWSLRVEPSGLSKDADASGVELVNAMLAHLELGGLLQCTKDGGMATASLKADGREITTLGQQRQAEYTAINLAGDWLAIAEEQKQEAMTQLGLDALGNALLMFDYTSLKAGDTPFVTALYNTGLALWGFASPYSEDSNRITVSSGATSHGVTYEIDTAAMRAILGNWADSMTADGLSIGLAGTDLFLGISEEALEEIRQRIKAFAGSTELAKPFTLSTAFGEGDVLQRAKGSGTIQEGDRRTGVSYGYTCSLSSTRITRKYSIDFQPREADTLVLNLTLLTSSNNKSSGASEVKLSASGTYNGEPYKLTLASDLINKYGETGDGRLEETISGKITAQLKYAGETVADVSIVRLGTTRSTTGLTTAVEIEDSYDVTIKNDERTLFAGLVTMAYSVPDGTEDVPDVLEKATWFDELDFIGMQDLRLSMEDVLAGAQERLVKLLPTSQLGALKDADRTEGKQQ